MRSVGCEDGVSIVDFPLQQQQSYKKDFKTMNAQQIYRLLFDLSANNQPIPLSTAVPFLSKALGSLIAKATTLKKGSAGGIDGWKYELLSQTYDEQTKHLWTRLFIRICLGDTTLPHHLWNTMAEARLIPLAYTDKPGKIRPIAITSVISRMAFLFLDNMIPTDMKKEAGGPHQYATGVRGGCEAMAYAIQRKLKENPHLAAISIDVKNAFNEIDRSHCLESTRKKCPMLFQMARMTLATRTPRLIISNRDPMHPEEPPTITTLFSREGVMQGCPASMLIYCIGVSEAYAKINEEVQRLTTLYLANPWRDIQRFTSTTTQQITNQHTNQHTHNVLAYADDCNILIHKELIDETLCFTQKTLKGINCVVQPTKCTLFLRDNRHHNFITDLHIDKEGYITGGIPIGNKSKMMEHIEQLKHDVGNACDFIDQINEALHSQTAHLSFHALRLCVITKVSYAIRTIPFSAQEELQESLESLQQRVLQCLGNILQLSEEELHQATPQIILPIREGGLGLGLTMVQAASAFTAGTITALTDFKARFAMDNPATLFDCGRAKSIDTWIKECASVTLE